MEYGKLLYRWIKLLFYTCSCTCLVVKIAILKVPYLIAISEPWGQFVQSEHIIHVINMYKECYHMVNKLHGTIICCRVAKIPATSMGSMYILHVYRCINKLLSLYKDPYEML